MSWLMVPAVVIVFFLWAVFAHPTPDERANARDKVCHTTGVNWR